MNFKIESQREKFITKYDINIKKYTTDEIVDDLEENISNVFLFVLNILLPILITCLISVIISVYFAYSYHSMVFGILLFVFSIPIFLFGAGSFGVVRAVNTLCACINYILNYTMNVVTDIKKINNTNNNEKTSDIFEFTLYGIAFPIIKKIIRNNFFGEILNFFIKKISIKGSKILSDSYEENESITISEENIIHCDEKHLMKVPKSINNISKKVLASVILIVKVFGVISIVVGFILETILFFMH